MNPSIPFLRTIWFAPTDPTPRYVYADWLEERGEVGLAIMQRQWAETIGKLDWGIEFRRPYFYKCLSSKPEIKYMFQNGCLLYCDHAKDYCPVCYGTWGQVIMKDRFDNEYIQCTKCMCQRIWATSGIAYQYKTRMFYMGYFNWILINSYNPRWLLSERIKHNYYGRVPGFGSVVKP